MIRSPAAAAQCGRADALRASAAPTAASESVTLAIAVDAYFSKAAKSAPPTMPSFARRNSVDGLAAAIRLSRSTSVRVISKGRFDVWCLESCADQRRLSVSHRLTDAGGSD